MTALPVAVGSTLVNGWRPAATISQGPRSVQGALALEMDRRPGPPEVPASQPLAGADVVPVTPALRGAVHRWALQLAQACVEVVGGDRPVSQLVRWTTPAVHEELARRATVVTRARGGRRQPRVRPQVRNVRTCFVAEGTVELCARVRYGERDRALAGRLEVISGRWQCTALEFG